METPEETTLMRLTSDRAVMEQELEENRVERSKSALELQGIREQLRRATERYTALAKAVNFLRSDEAPVVSFNEYKNFRENLDNNRVLITAFESQAATAQKKGNQAAQRAKNLETELQHLEKRMSAYGQVVPFPVPFKGSPADDQEEDPGDDD